MTRRPGRRISRRRLALRCLGPAAASALAALCLGLAGPQMGHARSAEDADASRSLLGSYLAGRFARAQQDTTQAANFYRSALDLDPGNEVVLEQAFLMEVSTGDWADAGKLGRELVEKQPQHRMAHVFLGLDAFKRGAWEEADTHFKVAGTGPIGELTSSLARAWVKLAQGDAPGALELADLPKQAEWAQFYVAYHKALIADIGGRTMEARAQFEKVFKQDNRTLRTTLAYAQHAAAFGDTRLAKSILKEHMDRAQGDGHPLARDLRDRLDAGERVRLLVPDATQGLAEVFYGLGEALTGEGGVSLGVLYLQMALFLAPEQPFALSALASGYETAKKYTDAIATYDRIPKGTALQPAIEIRKALDLNSLDRPDEARDILEKVAAADPGDFKALDALGNIMRARKRYEEAVDYYSRVIAMIEKPEKRHWIYYYSRGTSYERMKNWAKAEVDLQKALQLYPDQPLVLNYLGYSWIDQNKNLKQGMQLIEKAVSLKPDDGYIVDSLGWAHFRQGNWKDAVRYLERAVELRPEDPVLNDHLGDALWRVGRQREARFQWDQALTLSPEPEDAEKIKKKLIKGLPQPVPQVTTKKPTREAHTEVAPQPQPPVHRRRPSTPRPVVE